MIHPSSPFRHRLVFALAASTGLLASAGTLDMIQLAVAAGAIKASPTLRSVSPTSGSPGDAVTLSGRNLIGATRVAFNGTAADFTVVSAREIQAVVPMGASTGPISVTTPDGTAVSSTPFTVLPAPPSGVDVYVSKVMVGQATQRSGNDMRLCMDKRGFVRVFLQANQSNTAKPQVLARFFQNGTLVHDTTLAPPAGLTGVPTSASDAEFGKTWIGTVPAAVFKPGLSVQVIADPNGAVPDPNRGNNTWPAMGTQAMAVEDTHPFRLTFVPLLVQVNGASYLGRIESSNMDRFLDMFQRIWPVPEAIDRQIHLPFTPSTIPDPNYAGYTWETVLNELAAMQAAENAPDRYYYGVYNSYYGTAGGTGMAWLGRPQAMGIDWDLVSSGHTFTWRAGTLAHEVGHNLNRPHSPGCRAGNPDRNYPYRFGKIGTYGYDTWAQMGYDADANYDVMGYCGYTWVSDYCVDKVMDFRLSGDTTVPQNAAGPAGPSTLIWGTVKQGVVDLNPAFTVDGAASKAPEGGSYFVDLVSAQGKILGHAAFEPSSASHGEGQGFAFVLPSQEAASLLQAEGALRIHRNGTVLAERKGRKPVAAPEGSEDLQAIQISKGLAKISWNVNNFPMIMVKDPATKQVIAFGRGGEATLASDAETLEIHLSNGIASHAIEIPVRP